MMFMDLSRGYYKFDVDAADPIEGVDTIVGGVSMTLVKPTILAFIYSVLRYNDFGNFVAPTLNSATTYSERMQSLERDTSFYHVYAVLIQNIKDLLNSRNYSIHHSLREGNHCVDFMAKLGATTDVDLTVYSSPPEDLLSLLLTDEMGTLFLRN
ncbi:hypothetical protein MTR_1g056190 [Medicago truncatula]|uniref:RNase H type-1 domain-containing protein n=1 Tax=Medicago truncatula TaxID=3880 RepID=G7I7Z6_MEDTR|nr:hypothetical protein MTR_1g056190 [Medicago truncatula]